jgi:hypothetical protein
MCFNCSQRHDRHGSSWQFFVHFVILDVFKVLVDEKRVNVHAGRVVDGGDALLGGVYM